MIGTGYYFVEDRRPQFFNPRKQAVYNQMVALCSVFVNNLLFQRPPRTIFETQSIVEMASRVSYQRINAVQS